MWSGIGFVAAIVSTGAGIGLLTHWADFSAWANNNQGVAGWAQAVGAVAAIFGAFWLGERQLVAARRLDDERRSVVEIEKLEALHEMFHLGFATCEALRQADSRDPKPWMQREFGYATDIADVFQRLPPLEIPGEGIAVIALQAAKSITDVRNAAEVCTADWVPLTGKQDVDIPSRSRLELHRAYGHAEGLLKSGKQRCRERIEALQIKVSGA